MKIFVNPFGTSSAAGNTYLTIGYQPFQQDSAPSAQEIINMPRSMVMTASQTVQSPFMIPRQVLLGQTSLKWWRRLLPSQLTNTAGNPLPTSNLFDSVQGCLWFIANTNQSFSFRVQYVIEFQGPEDTNLGGPTELLRVITSQPVVASFPVQPSLCYGHHGRPK